MIPDIALAIKVVEDSATAAPVMIPSRPRIDSLYSPAIGRLNTTRIRPMLRMINWISCFANLTSAKVSFVFASKRSTAKIRKRVTAAVIILTR